MPTLFNRKEIQKLFGAKSYLETNVSELFLRQNMSIRLKSRLNWSFWILATKKSAFG
jgi:hypothetical protein